MKIKCVLMFFALSCFAAFAQEEEILVIMDDDRMSAGIGVEWNMNARENFAAGVAVNFNYNLPYSLAAGVNLTISNDFSGITVLEPAALFRWYFLGSGHSGFFAQAEAGVFIVLENDAKTQALFLGGLRGGFRLPIGALYVEPYGRFGYPFAFGIGVNAGITF